MYAYTHTDMVDSMGIAFYTVKHCTLYKQYYYSKYY